MFATILTDTELFDRAEITDENQAAVWIKFRNKKGRIEHRTIHKAEIVERGNYRN